MSLNKKMDYMALLSNLVQKNNKFELNKLFSKWQLNDENILKLHAENNLNLILNAHFMVANEEKLVSLLDKIKLLNLKFKLTNESLYYLVRENDKAKLLTVINFSNEYLSQSLKQEKIGDYLCKAKDETTLAKAIKLQNEDLIKILIEECGASIDLGNSLNFEPIYIAAGLKNEQITKYLITMGANINTKTSLDDTPLIKACQNRNLNNIKLLIESGADVNLKGYNGNSPLGIVVTDDVYHDNDEIPSLEALKIILNTKNLDLTTVNNNGVSPFLRACGTTNLGMVKMLYDSLHNQYASSLYLENQIRQGLLYSINFLRVDTFKYLIRLVENKKAFSSDLNGFFNYDINQQLLKYFEKVKYKTRLNKIYEIFMLLIKYDFTCGQSPLFYIQKYVFTMRHNFFLNLTETEHLLIAQRNTFISFIINLIKELETHGKISFTKLNIAEILSYFDQYTQDNNIHILKTELALLLNQLKANKRETNSLRVLCRNCIRDSMVSLSDYHINKLYIPVSLKSYLIS